MQGAKAEHLWRKTAREGNSLSQRQAVLAQDEPRRADDQRFERARSPSPFKG